jgi:hypothetical protein
LRPSVTRHVAPAVNDGTIRSLPLSFTWHRTCPFEIVVTALRASRPRRPTDRLHKPTRRSQIGGRLSFGESGYERGEIRRVDGLAVRALPGDEAGAGTQLPPPCPLFLGDRPGALEARLGTRLRETRPHVSFEPMELDEVAHVAGRFDVRAGFLDCRECFLQIPTVRERFGEYGKLSRRR